MEFDPEQFYLFLDICTRDAILPVRALRQISALNWVCYDYCAPLLNKFAAIRARFEGKFGYRLYRRLIGYPFEYKGTIRTVNTIDNMRFDRLCGLQIFDHDPLAMSRDFLTQYRCALKNIILWCVKPIDFIALITISYQGRSTVVAYMQYTCADFVPMFDDELVAKNGRQLWALDMNLPFKHNQLLLGSPIIPHTALHLGCTPELTIDDKCSPSFLNAPEFYSLFISHVIAQYDYLPDGDYSEYRANFQIRPNNAGLRVKSVIIKK